MKKRLRNDMSELEFFKHSLKKKDERRLKTGQYHFSLPSQIEKKYELLNSIRAGNVKKAMQFLWKKFDT